MKIEPARWKPSRPCRLNLPLPQIGEAFVERFAERELGERWKISDGWSNGAWMANDWRASQVDVTPGRLRITLAASEAGSAKPLAGGEIRTQAEYRYGYFEFRIRAPRDPGMVAGVFSYARAEDGGKPQEIDIEIAGRDTRTVEVTYHQGGVPRRREWRCRSMRRTVSTPMRSTGGRMSCAGMPTAC